MGLCISKPTIKPTEVHSYPITNFEEDKKDAYTNWGKNPSDYIYR